MKIVLQAALLACVVAGSSARAGTCQITGTIVDEATRLPLAGMCAEAYGLAGGEFVSAPTGSDGMYTLSALDPDTFQLVAYQCAPPIDHALVEYKSRGRSLHGAHDSMDGARLVRLRRDGKVKRNVNFNMPVAGHVEVTVVHDATGLAAAGVIVRPLAVPQPRRGSAVLSGFFGTSDDDGRVTLDVDPGGNTLIAIFGSAEHVTGPTVTVDPGGVQSAEIRVPY